MDFVGTPGMRSGTPAGAARRLAGQPAGPNPLVRPFIFLDHMHFLDWSKKLLHMGVTLWGYPIYGDFLTQGFPI